MVTNSIHKAFCGGQIKHPGAKLVVRPRITPPQGELHNRSGQEPNPPAGALWLGLLGVPSPDCTEQAQSAKVHASGAGGRAREAWGGAGGGGGGS